MDSFKDPDTVWRPVFLKLLGDHLATDAAHDIGHIQRVVSNAKQLCEREGADWNVVMPAAWLHDCVVVPKSSPLRTQASRLAARQAVEWLQQANWPHDNLMEISHAIESHSFSAGIPTETLEAEVLQDADRLDALGAIGIARTLMLGAEMKREFHHPADPFCEAREPDDSLYTLDHFYSKLLTLESTMRTASGRSEAAGENRVFENVSRSTRAGNGSLRLIPHGSTGGLLPIQPRVTS